MKETAGSVPIPGLGDIPDLALEIVKTVEVRSISIFNISVKSSEGYFVTVLNRMFIPIELASNTLQSSVRVSRL
ncbi:hypothetical protein L218DRAFT_961369 [Marasmius fiardii PR-910]|nr:hypothetical protein L218DRAFT_961369 [Marasmius fiardii PR-910]